MHAGKKFPKILETIQVFSWERYDTLDMSFWKIRRHCQHIPIFRLLYNIKKCSKNLIPSRSTRSMYLYLCIYICEFVFVFVFHICEFIFLYFLVNLYLWEEADQCQYVSCQPHSAVWLWRSINIRYYSLSTLQPYVKESKAGLIYNYNPPYLGGVRIPCEI